MLLQHKISQKILRYEENDLLRQMVEISDNDGREIQIDNKKYINFSGNDYLGLSKSQKVKQAFIEGVNLYGLGSGSSNLLSGYHSPSIQLEEAFAQKIGKDQAILFNSGYHANVGIIQALGMNIIMDRLSHASIIDGARLSGNKFHRYHDLNHAEKLLQDNEQSLLISERVFSMEGNITDVDRLSDLAKKYNSFLIIDDAHGFGILENNIDADCIVIPLGKALGSMGAIVAGSNDVINYLRQFARSYIYSTALPPAVIHASITSLKLLEEESWRLNKLKCLIRYFNIEAEKIGLDLISSDITPIRSILIKDNTSAKQIEKKLQNQGFFIKAIVPPTVQTSRLRISLSALHEEDDILGLIKAIESLLK
jgi:8-amino-7-oxononanoate synthase